MVLLVSSALFPAGRVFAMIVYVITRIFGQRKEGKSWNEVWSDGEQTLTGSVWLDGLLFIGILAAVAGLLWIAALWIQW
jgi:hypothetical protein